MKKFVLIFALVPLLVSNSFSDPKNIQSLILVGFTKTNRPVDTNSGRYSRDVTLLLKIKNTSDDIITAWRAILKVKNAFGDVVLTSRLMSNDSHIKPGEIEEAEFTWEDNQFISNEPYDQIANISQENIKISLSDVTVVTKPEKKSSVIVSTGTN